MLLTQKVLPSLGFTDSCGDNVSTDSSSTRSSFQDSSLREMFSASGFDSNANDSSTENDLFQSGSESDGQIESTGAKQVPKQPEDMFRRDYINKLMHMKVMRPQPKSKPHQTIVIFDWDDTLFPTSFLTRFGFEKVQKDSKIQKSLNIIDKYATKLLQKAARVGKACIITNATKNWVETSSEVYLPMTYETIIKNRISVISARAEYEDLYPNDPKRWKQEAFLNLKGTLEDAALTNIISVGDSNIELEAAQKMRAVLERALLKTLKFKELPSMEELIKQQEAVIDKFDQIHITLKNLTIKLERKN